MSRLRPVLEMTARRHPAYCNPHIVVQPRSTHASMGTVDSEDGPARGRLRGRLRGLSGVALAAGGSASSEASPGLSPGRLVAPGGRATPCAASPRIPLPGEAAHEPVTNGACVPAAYTPCLLGCYCAGSECADWAYDSPSEGSLPAAVGVEREPGQFPVPVLGVVGQDPPRGVASISGRSAWQVHDEVGVLGHRSYCA